MTAVVSLSVVPIGIVTFIVTLSSLPPVIICTRKVGIKTNAIKSTEKQTMHVVIRWFNAALSAFRYAAVSFTSGISRIS